MVTNLDTDMTYTERNKIGRLTKLYIDAKRNTEELLNKEAGEWRNHVSEPTPDDPYGNDLSFTEAYEKYILPKLSHKRREDLRLTIERIPADKPVITSAKEEEELVVTASDCKLLLERLDQLEKEIAMLKSQNAFADVVGK